MKTRHIIGIFALFATSLAFADTREHVMAITTNAFDGTFNIDVMRASTGEVTEMIYQTPSTSNGVLTVAQLKGSPKVIFNHLGHDAILLSSEGDFNPQKGGHLNVRYLNNGMDGTYKNFRVLVDIEAKLILRSDPNPSDPDSDENSYTSVFNQVFMEKNTVFGMTVGVDKVIPSLH